MGPLVIYSYVALVREFVRVNYLSTSGCGGEPWFDMWVLVTLFNCVNWGSELIARIVLCYAMLI